MVQDQRIISRTQMAIMEMPQNGSLSTFSCNLYHEEFIFFTFHAKSGHWKGGSGAAKFTPRGTTYVFVNVVVAPRYVARVQPGSGGL